MPNHCHNYVQIRGPEEVMESIVKKLTEAKKKDDDEYPCILATLLPVPAVVELRCVEGGAEALAKYQETKSPKIPAEFLHSEFKHGHDWLLEEQSVDNGKELFDKAIEELEDPETCEWIKTVTDSLKTGWGRPKIAAWGAKWGYYYIEWDTFDKQEISFSASSAWGPPLLGLERLSRKLGLEISTIFDEPGMNFAGQTTFKDGVVTEDIEYSVYWSKPEVPLSEELFKAIAPYQRLCMCEDTGDYVCTEMLENGSMEDVELDELSYREYLLLCEKGRLPAKTIMVDDGFLYRNWDFDLRPYNVQTDKDTKRITSIHIEEFGIDVGWDEEKEQEYIVLDNKMIYLDSILQSHT